MLNLNDREWKPFFLTELFPTIQRGKRLKSEDHMPGKVPYVSSSAMSNGVDNFVSNTKRVRIFSKCLSLANSGSVGSSFYEPFYFVASDHVTHLKNSRYNKYHYLFIATLTSRLSQKYNFNREINDRRISREKIVLPVDADGNPDLDFMEEYCKEREEQLIQKYREFISKIAQTGGGGYSPLIQQNGEYLTFVIFLLSARERDGQKLIWIRAAYRLLGQPIQIMELRIGSQPQIPLLTKTSWV